MKKILLFLFLLFSLVACAQDYRSDIVVLDSVSKISSYYGGSKVIYVRDSINGGTFVLYQGASPVDGRNIVSGANSSKWKRDFPQTYRQLSGYPALRAISNSSLSANYTIAVLYNGTVGYFRYDASDNSSVDDSAMVIVTGSGARFKRIVDDGMLDVRWFGATPNDGIDDIYAIQKAVNYALYNNYSGVFIPGGQFHISKGILVWKDTNSDGDPDQVNINIFGAKTAITATGQNETVISVTGSDNFGLAIQKGKGCSVKNINFIGTNSINYNLATAWADTTSYVLGAQRTNQYSPYAGVVLDPFGSSTTGSDRYPGFTSYYAGVVGNGGSTDCKFENISVSGFVVGIILTPNGNTQNNESHLFDGIWINNCKDGFVTTNSQERQVYVKNLKSWSNVKTVFRTYGYGAGRGEPPNIDGANIAGNIYELFYFGGVGGYFPLVSVKNVYAESFYRIGTVYGRNIGFKDCHFSFGLTTQNNLKVQDWLYTGGATTFDNCMLVFYDGTNATPMNFVGMYFKFNNCYLSNQIGVPINQWSENNPDVQYTNCRFYSRNGVTNGDPLVSIFSNYRFFYGGNTKFVNIGDQHVTYTFSELYDGTIPSSYAMQKRVIKSRMDKWIYLGNISVTVSGTTATASIPGIAGKTHLQNLIIKDAYESNASGVQLGRLYSVDSVGNVVFDRITNRFTTGTYKLWIEDLQQFYPPFMFNSDGTNITNVYEEGNTPTKKSLETNKTYYFNSKPVLVSSSDTNTTSTLSGYRPTVVTRGILANYDYDESGQSLGNPATNGYFVDGVLFTEGSFYINTRTNNSDSLVYGYRCIKTGIKGTPYPPEFEVIYKDKQSGSGYQLVSNSSNKVKSLTSGYGLIIDSSVANQVNYKADTATLFAAAAARNLGGSTYTPTKYLTTNLDSVNFSVCYYQKISDYVYVFGEVYVDPTNQNTDTEIGMSLPVASTLTSSYYLSGNGSSDTVQDAVRIFADTSNNRARIKFKTTTNTGHVFSFTYTYKIN